MTDPIKDLPTLPAERTIKVVGGRWKALIVYHLLGGPKRPVELKRLLPGLSQKVLGQQLRELEVHRIVERTVTPTVPLRVDYSVTPFGRTLAPVLQALCDWGRAHAEELGDIDDVARCDV